MKCEIIQISHLATERTLIITKSKICNYQNEKIQGICFFAFIST